MVKYDYSLDIGQSIETDKKLNKEQPEGCCPVPPPEEPEKQEEPIEEEIVEDTEEHAEEPKEEPKEKKVEIKPVSFEKAKLISDYAGQEDKKTEEHEKTPAQIPEEIKDEEIPEINRAEEDEEDVNEFLEDSFKKETQEREEYNNSKIKKAPPKQSKKWIWALIAAIIIISAGWYGYSQLKTPTSAAITTEPELNITNHTFVPEIQNTTEPVTENKPENISIDNALEQLTHALKD